MKQLFFKFEWFLLISLLTLTLPISAQEVLCDECEVDCVRENVGIAGSFGYPVKFSDDLIDQHQQKCNNDNVCISYEPPEVSQDFQPTKSPDGLPLGHLGEDWQIGKEWWDSWWYINRGERTYIDSSTVGMPIYAIANGCVVKSGAKYGWAGYLIMKHYLPNGSYILSVYGHLNPDVTQENNLAGRTYKKGDEITKTATTEQMQKWTMFGPHLHFEIRGTSKQSGINDDALSTGYKDFGMKQPHLLENGVLQGAHLTEVKRHDGKIEILSYASNFKGYFDPTDVKAIVNHAQNFSGDSPHRGFIDWYAKAERFEHFLCVFTDIIEGKQHGAVQEAIKKLCLEGIIKGNGDGTFNPDGTVTRAELSKLIILTKLVDEKNVSPGRLPDLSATDPVMWKKTRLEVNVGKNNVGKNIETYFEPKENQGQGKENQGQGIETEFTDVTDDWWYYPYITTLAKLGVIHGYIEKGNNNENKRVFKPDGKVTRAEMIKMIIKGLGGVQDTNVKDTNVEDTNVEDTNVEDTSVKKYWASGYLECALGLHVHETKYSLLLEPKQGANWCNTQGYSDVDKYYCLIGEQPATRAEAAFAIQRLREFKRDSNVTSLTCNQIVTNAQ